jgi:hypothetical protein
MGAIRFSFGRQPETGELLRDRLRGHAAQLGEQGERQAQAAVGVERALVNRGG